jgi:hypothetical protein
MARKRGRQPNDPYTSLNVTGEKQDNFACVYEGLVKHEKFLSLPLSTRATYIICCVHMKSKEGRSNLYMACKENDINPMNTMFVFPAKHMKQYGIKNRQQGYKALKELEQNGFIEVVAKNRHRHKQNIYKLSKKWKGG